MWLVSQPEAQQTVRRLKVSTGTFPSLQAGPEEKAAAKEPRSVLSQQKGAWDTDVIRQS